MKPNWAKLASPVQKNMTFQLFAVFVSMFIDLKGYSF